MFYQSPVFSTNAENAVNFQVNFRNLHHSLQGLKLPSLHIWKIENLIFVHYLGSLFTPFFTSLFTYIIIYIKFYSKT